MNGNVAEVRNSDFVGDIFSVNNKCINYGILRKLKQNNNIDTNNYVGPNIYEVVPPESACCALLTWMSDFRGLMAHSKASEKYS
jgi:hypothetical protein